VSRFVNAKELREFVAESLPRKYEPLSLTFYGRDVRENGDLIIFGDDYGTNLCLSLSQGFIYSVDPKNEVPTRFVNTNVECLAKSLFVHQQYANQVAITASEVEQLTILRKLRDELIQIDARVFNHTENWWAVVLEQSENGLL